MVRLRPTTVHLLNGPAYIGHQRNVQMKPVALAIGAIVTLAVVACGDSAETNDLSGLRRTPRLKGSSPRWL